MKKKCLFFLGCFLFTVLVFSPTFLKAEIFQNQQILSRLVFQIRDPKTASGDFRISLEKIGEILALKILQELPTKEKSIQTLTNAFAHMELCCEKPVLFTILRGGIPLLLGMQRVFPDSDVGFFGMSRNEETLLATTSYIAMPDVKDKIVIIADTMLATGGSFLQAIERIEKEKPKKIILVSAIAAKEGIDRIVKSHPNIEILAAAIDPKLNEKGYIVPGLGDAGDRCYGVKH
jgi:uracil phosphoribosyltransferase